ncbi:bifunctional helix-turn-helix transcriptional regulator/GNAT family N-acetyltransferase [Streptomyces beihaiensis]|uniref:Bifunctional helix-turn-helix transcriptional regulator/GNAT family N-acetyltransferase n=1 Tax=Streptomyces beihaiensis TaxID=2984495 RepID=A0ABT3TX57_9ACTN|nr:MarR family winged helix-turn-helix transcriptional regulator [Streptomyces beihaiensis]MCX3061629.1 bifunctional helix-turn-helix transcriptional regulator/GNAT family N-acetyltransferase [Streptomyces beihaiensis]
MDAAHIDRVRHFNRTVTERVGVLQNTYLGRDRPLGQARLLWEIGEQGQDVRRLRERLGLDSGYVSRLLAALAADGLVIVEAHPRDRRVRTVRLTAAGRAEREVLDERSDDLACALLEPLAPEQRERLVAAMAEVDRLLTASAVVVEPADPGHPDARHCLERYFAELGDAFDTGFEPERSLLPDAGELRPPHGEFLIARLHGEPVGCVGLKLADPRAAEVKRMWVAPRARRLGLGRRFLVAMEERAGAAGRSLLRLDTNKALDAARSLYLAHGFREVAPFNDEPYAHHWFEKSIAPGA